MAGPTPADASRLTELISSRPPCVYIPTHEEAWALTLVREAVCGDAEEYLTWSIIDGLRDGLVRDQPAIPETEHPAGALFYLYKRIETVRAAVMLDLVAHLEDARTARLARQLVQRCAETKRTLILIDHRDELPPVLASEAVRFELSLPGDGEIESLVTESLRNHHQQSPLRVDIPRSAFDAILRNLRGLTRREILRIIEETVATDRVFNADDLDTVLTRKRQLVRSGGLLEFITAPASMDDVAGLTRLKAWLNVRRKAMQREAEAVGISAPRGILLLGVQGSGKSYCAKAVATAWQRPLLRLDPGALYDRYIGESERRLRDALGQAERMAPIVLWIDEIEKGFASAASRNIDGGLSQRMFGSLLTWMQEHRAPVFIVATANDIEALPPELLRKGRFDEIFFVDLPTPAVREQVFTIHLRKRSQDPSKIDVAALAAATDGFSGAEIEQAIISALHDAFATKAKLTTDQLLAAVQATVPLSVTMDRKVAALRAWAATRCVQAD
ncbi:ATP-dependent zinc metalloprotease FtsH [Phycisphaerae bacterium RAS2]|nr:ATP-dependent zinc metalloprotease FtsH [Phycisphaerae bacterium RAS2]